MAVVMMRMIPATSAGVVFTRDPSGTDGARVESVDGLAESLVSGQKTPSAWVGDSTTLLSAVPEPARIALELSQRIEEAAGVPQDVEWAAIGDKVWIVQARPITVLDDHDGFDTPIDDHELTTAGIAEMIPGVLPPLGWALNQFMLDEAFRSVLANLGVLRGSEHEDRRLVRRVRGRVAIDFDQLRAIASEVPGAVEQLEDQYFGTTDGTTGRTTTPNRSRLARTWLELQSIRTQRVAIDAADVVVQSVQRIRPRRPALNVASDTWLLAYASRLTDLAARGLAAELGVAAAAAATYQQLESLLIKYLGKDGVTAALRVVSGVGAGVDHESHASAWVFAGPTWEESGSAPPGVDVDVVEQGRRRAQMVSELRRQVTTTPGWGRRRLLTGQVIDVRFRVLRRLIEQTVDHLRRREATKAAFLELGGEVRRVHLELGARLVRRRMLDDAVDVALMTPAEIQSAIQDGSPVRPDELRNRRNWISCFEAEGSLPHRFRGLPTRTPEPLPSGRILRGWAASPGRRHGRARVVRHRRDLLLEGEILVAETTDPSWSPLFVRAGAIVVERGGPLSHAAILARELGLPAVLNVEGATRVLDRRLVTVDGTSGRIVIEEEST